jgi:hypothetical protein
MLWLVACGSAFSDEGDRGSSSASSSASSASGSGGASSSSGNGGDVSASSSTSGAAGAGGSSASGGTGGAGGGCPPACLKEGFSCCDGKCVNTANDIHNCGGCGTSCPGKYCDKGSCGNVPCDGGIACIATKFCCGKSCCDLDQLCCTIPGPVAMLGPECANPIDGTCPMGCLTCACADRDTPIATPDGERAIASLKKGDLVYSVHRGVVTVVPVQLVNRVPVVGHSMIELELEGGRRLRMSAEHPTADGARIGDLAVGSHLHGHAVTARRLVDYPHAATYDILPASDSASYFAAGALVGSTLHRGRPAGAVCHLVE